MIKNKSTLFQEKQKKYNWWAFLYVLAVLFCFYPYEFYSVYLLFLPEESYITALVLLVVTLFLLIVRKNDTSALKYVLTAFLMQFLGLLITGVAHKNLIPVFSTGVNMLLALSLVLLVNGRIGLDRFFEKYNGWIMLMAILGCVTFILVETINFQPLYVVSDRADGRPLFNYILSFSKSDESLIGIVRFAGFFDEPGAIACWGIYALIISRLFVKNQWLETVLGVSLLFTFSIGYYIQYSAYLLLFNLFGKHRRQTFVLAILFFIVIGGIMMTRDTNDNEIYERTFGRIENLFTESREASSTIAVGDRATFTENALKEFKENPLFGTSRTDVKVGNNVYEPLALYGIVGSAFILFPFLQLLIWGFKYKDLDLFKCCIVIILGFTHRPFHTNILYFFILYCIIVMYRQKRRCRQYEASVYTSN